MSSTAATSIDSTTPKHHNTINNVKTASSLFLRLQQLQSCLAYLACLPACLCLQMFTVCPRSMFISYSTRNPPYIMPPFLHSFLDLRRHTTPVLSLRPQFHISSISSLSSYMHLCLDQRPPPSIITAPTPVVFHRRQPTQPSLSHNLLSSFLILPAIESVSALLGNIDLHLHTHTHPTEFAGRCEC